MAALLRLPQVTALVGLRPTRIYELMGSNEFPLPIRLGQRAVAWHSDEIEKWIAQRARAPRAEIRTKSKKPAAEAAA